MNENYKLLIVKSSKVVRLIVLLISITFISCEKDSVMKTYTVSGTINSIEQDPKGFRLDFHKVHDYGTTTDVDFLGSTTIDSNNNFSFEYQSDVESRPAITLSMSLYNTEGKSEYNFSDLAFATNISNNFNYSSFALVELTFLTSNPLKEGDSLFITHSKGRDTLLYPLANGYKKLYRILNQPQYIGWSRDSKKIGIGLREEVKLVASGAPTIDQVEINY